MFPQEDSLRLFFCCYRGHYKETWSAEFAFVAICSRLTYHNDCTNGHHPNPLDFVSCSLIYKCCVLLLLLDGLYSSFMHYCVGISPLLFSGPFAIAIGDSDMVYANWVAVDIVAQPGPSIKNRLLCLGFTTPDMPELVNYIWYREFSAIVTTRHNCLTWKVKTKTKCEEAFLRNYGTALNLTYLK